MKYGSLERTVSAQVCMSGEKEYEKSETVEVAKLPFELILCAESGGFELVLNGKTFDINEGEAMLVPFNTAYTLSARSGSVVCYVALGLYVYYSLRIFSLFELPAVFRGEEGKAICDICEEIRVLCDISGFTNSRLENAVKLKSDTYRLASAVLEKSIPLFSHDDIMARHEKVSKVLMYIGEHIDENIMQAELSDLLEMSPDSFYRLFKNLIGTAPKDFIISEKLRSAREMLVMTDMPIGEISEQMGYDNQLYFSALFRKKYGVCPKEYKKETARII